MSEPLPNVPPAPPPPKARDAAVAILFRPAEVGVEVYWLKRETGLSFAGGFFAFPGGGVEPADASVPVDGDQGEQAVLCAAAARELFEETGVLVAAGDAPGPEALAAQRRALLTGQTSFAALLESLRLKLRQSDFRPAGRWITPRSLPKRFDARFFLVEAPASAQPQVLPGEASMGQWIRPSAALQRWEEGSALLHPPNLHALECLKHFTTPTAVAEALSHPPNCPGHIPIRVEFQRGIQLFPLETLTLPPATHTNCYVLGNGQLLIVDPGAAQVRQYARLLALIESLKAEGKTPLAVFLTHHHSDHIGGARAVMERLEVPLWCHALTAERLPFPADRLFGEGELITLQGVPPMRFQVLHTPGHARGHLCLVEESSRAAIVGDMVAGIGTIVIDPPEGDMAEYLKQLARLKGLPVGALYPAHGPPVVDGPGKLAEYLLHRQMREKKLLEALPAEGLTLSQLVAKAYDDVAPEVHPIAERNTQAILIKLAREGRVQRQEDRYLRV